MPSHNSTKEPPVIVIIIGCLIVIGAVVWGVGKFFNLQTIRGWMVESFGGWAIILGVLVPGLVVGWILKRVFE